jgi:hypothetical protein
MPFTSWDFLLYFLPLTVVAFHLIPPRPTVWRKILLVFASMVFYAWFSFWYAGLLVVSMVLNYSVGEWLGYELDKKKQKLIAVAGVSANLLLLFHFKYYGMFRESLGGLFGISFETLPVVLPLAISFYTFTQIGYVIDVAKKPSIKHGFVDYCLFVVFFPHLIAGPVVRHSEIVPQFANRELSPRSKDFAMGITLFLMGLYKKTLLADPVSVHADWIFNQASSGGALSMFSAWVGSIAYGLQIYFDFSGYSDMALGLACMFAIRFPINFNSPYKSSNITDFWKRWHMSLTRFFRDYLYIPFGGNRLGLLLQIRNILITFLVSGLWHGAGWTFVIWGALHGLYLATHLTWKRITDRMGWSIEGRSWTALASLITLMAVTFAWVFFRAADVDSALRMSSMMLGLDGVSIPERWAVRLDSLPFLSSLVHGVTIPSPSIGWFWLCTHLSALSVIALFMPNTNQLLSGCQRLMGDSKVNLAANLRLRPVHGFVLGFLLMGFVYTKFGSAPSPFIYFNF